MNQYAIFALPDPETCDAIRGFQNRLSGETGNFMAQKFPVHITLFRPCRVQRWSIPSWLKTAQKACDEFKPFSFDATGPVRVDSAVEWYELSKGFQGYKEICWLHSLVFNVLRRVGVEDEDRNAFQGEHYRPHLTLGWGARKKAKYPKYAAGTPNIIRGSIEKIAVARYPLKWPDQGRIVLEWVSGSGI